MSLFQREYMDATHAIGLVPSTKFNWGALSKMGII